MPAGFSELPLDLLTVIFQHIPRPHDFTVLARVNKAFHSFAVPFLYSEVRVYQWHNEWKDKIRKLFDTLSRRPEFAQYVKELVLREFPRQAYGTAESAELETAVLSALPNLASLKSLSWTRDGTLTSAYLERISEHCHQLESLELNGHSANYYDPHLLLNFKRVENLTVIMPDRAFVNCFEEWIQQNGARLRTLSLISKQSPLINDATMERLASAAPHLKHIHLLGNPRVTHTGVASISANCLELEALYIEGTDFDMQALSILVSSSPFPALTSLSLTLPTSSSPITFFDGVYSVFRTSPLTEFTIWRAGGDISHLKSSILPIDFIRSFLLVHGKRLRKFAVQRLETGMEVIEEVTKRCPMLENFFMVLGPCEMDVLAFHLRRLTQLHTVHVSYTFANRNPIVAVPPSSSAAHESHASVRFVRQCPRSLRIIGFMTRVYEVRHNWILLNKDPVEWKDEPEVTLERYSGQAIPEVFLVMKA
ncbi:hypothetical protein M407DRAFT_28316 [Tulasnella calospora MUT 4182]|uniref:F-box domain-containing protein n=1 Tax=Tulasnella calospora MUT 4182 TaxID=1051891 RepID=A0A0C3KL56_9AGAM|nr:hypothetical protein M407DRAFT_28316 [Tulasnella calospora MUT 4182]